MVTIGVFDGVHLGHQHLIQQLKDQATARNLLSVVITFENHPEEVLGKRGHLPWLTGVEERCELLRKLGVQMVTAIPFDAEVAGLGPREVMSLLTCYLRMKGLLVGPDFALGKSRQGDIATLARLGKEMGFSLGAVGALVLDGRVVSSTAVREAVARGDARDYFKLVGRHYSLSGTVIRGDERGRRLGFPTANLAIDNNRAIPANGVYATLASFDSKRLPSVTNIGVRPTFNTNLRLAETYVLDFSGDLYGKNFKIDFVERLRDEICFSNVHQLKQQMQRDADCARSLLLAEGLRR
ncbi:MAG: bifunctional riboflavin kinase/FAD synthetase [Chloroflexi bacterium]|nr:bifunctional riboflavin kinase/FAD synthetase [Chloroflexota bacterium]